MKKITIFIMSTIIGSFALANFEIPNQFEDGQVTSASQMNENFQVIKSAIENLQSMQKNSTTFYGFSEPVIGTAGVHAFSQACSALVSGSRLCIGDELIVSAISPSTLINHDGHAWIARKLAHANLAGGSGSGGFVGRTTEWIGSLQSCANGNGHTILNGQFSSSNCENSHPVACCK
jgi:hypothetical protein